MNLAPGPRASRVIMVERSDTAVKMGSGDVPVLATPRLLAFAEGLTMQLAREGLDDGETSVGTRISLEHRAASPVGAHVRLDAELTEVDGRRLVFEASASWDGTVLFTATIERMVVDRERFLARLSRSSR
ncbi:thioesterase family protein [Streptosporangiaceae bacterium NEAU-GS5]|nr:thioesterase family protein [Streptosporangiaceae bacterium NEAU-GS5]